MPVVHIVDVVDGAVRSLTVDRVVSHTNINTEPLVGAGSVSAEDRLPIHDRLQDPLQDLDIRYASTTNLGNGEGMPIPRNDNAHLLTAQSALGCRFASLSRVTPRKLSQPPRALERVAEVRLVCLDHTSQGRLVQTAQSGEHLVPPEEGG